MMITLGTKEPADMTPQERLDEITTIISAGVIRLLNRKKAQAMSHGIVTK